MGRFKSHINRCIYIIQISYSYLLTSTLLERAIHVVCARTGQPLATVCSFNWLMGMSSSRGMGRRHTGLSPTTTYPDTMSTEDVRNARLLHNIRQAYTTLVTHVRRALQTQVGDRTRISENVTRLSNFNDVARQVGLFTGVYLHIRF